MVLLLARGSYDCQYGEEVGSSLSKRVVKFTSNYTTGTHGSSRMKMEWEHMK